MALVFNPANRFFWSLAIFLFIISGLFYLVRGLKKEEKNEKLLLIGFANFLFISTYVQYIFVFFAFERITKHSRYFLTFLESVFILITIFFDTTDFHYLLDFSGAIIFVFILIWLSLKSSIEFRAISVYFFIGGVIMLTGNLLNSKTIRNLNIISPEFAPLIVIIGAVVFMLPSFINPQIFSHSVTYWVFLIIANIISLIFYLNLLYVAQYHFFFSISVVLGLFLFPLVFIYAVIQLIKILKAHSISATYIEKDEKDQDYLRVFSKRPTITEEEISISKEKKICLVCKGNLTRSNIYLCPDCDTLYCLKCSEALSDVENACWVCNATFDESKPSKPYKTAEAKEKITVEESKKSKKESELKK